MSETVEIVRGNSPLILGMPHTGTDVPPGIFARFNKTGQMLADTDWHVHRLYDGLVENVTSVRALFHRYVIDPNRNPSGVSLYPGQNTTDLCPITDFDFRPLYLDGQAPTPEEIEERRIRYHQIYHDALATEIERVKAKHGFAILYDCHSIRSKVPHLFQGKLPDFNIGTYEGQSCASLISETVVRECDKANDFSHVLNGRFKGGWTTRHYGNPKQNVHAIQMELSQSTYMQEESPWTYLPEMANKIRPHLARLIENLTKITPEAL